MIVDKMDLMEKSIAQKLEGRVDKFAADDGAVVNTSIDVDREHINKEFTQVRVQVSKSSVYNFFISVDKSIEKVPKNFKFPMISLSLPTIYWFCGDKSKNIILICLLCRKYFETKTLRIYLTKT